MARQQRCRDVIETRPRGEEEDVALQGRERSTPLWRGGMPRRSPRATYAAACLTTTPGRIAGSRAGSSAFCRIVAEVTPITLVPTGTWSQQESRARGAKNSVLDLLDDDAIDAVDLGELHADDLLLRGRDVLADEVGPDRQLPVSTVDHHGELDRARAAEVDQRVHGGAHGPPGEQHVVDQDRDLAVDVDRDVRGRAHHRLGRDGREIVPVERDVEAALRRGPALELLD